MRATLLLLAALLMFGCSDDSTAGGGAADADGSVGAGDAAGGGGDVGAAGQDTPGGQDTAAVDAGGEPVEGIPCETNADCETGYCVPGPDGNVCTTECLENCPAGWKCALINNFGQDAVYLCVPKHVTLCRPCAEDKDCNPPGSAGGALCRSFGALQGSFCGGPCDGDADCPPGYACDGEGQCGPLAGECACSDVAVKQGLSTPCARTNAAGSCGGERRCVGDVGLTECDAVAATAEVCNTKDDDCNGQVDDGIPAQVCTKPTPFGACEGTSFCAAGATKCDAPDAAAESCNGADDDCDGEADEGYADTDDDGAADCVDDDDDGDGVLDAADNCPLVPNGDQANFDLDEQGDACDADDDNDGAADTADCAPFDAAVFPGNDEACNGKDDDCDTAVDEGFKDLDGDGQADCVDLDDDGDEDPDDTDCAPANPAIHHAATEACNGADDDCDGATDEADATGCGDTWFDGDGDGWGKTADVQCLCTTFGKYTALQPGDCNDASGGVYPGAPELCNGIDDSCNDTVDEGYPDADGDGQANCIDADDDGDGDPDATDCESLNPKIHHGATESCFDTVDNNCDGSINDPGGTGCVVYYFDGDEDGVGVEQTSQCLCFAGGKYTAQSFGDCKDDDAAVSPLKSEQCNGKDDNCSGVTDEGYPDSDKDGLANCVDPDDDNDGDPDETDCAPTTAAISHLAQEVCGDGLDNNCSGAADEGCP